MNFLRRIFANSREYLHVTNFINGYALGIQKEEEMGFPDYHRVVFLDSLYKKTINSNYLVDMKFGSFDEYFISCRTGNTKHYYTFLDGNLEEVPNQIYGFLKRSPMLEYVEFVDTNLQTKGLINKKLHTVFEIECIDFFYIGCNRYVAKLNDDSYMVLKLEDFSSIKVSSEGFLNFLRSNHLPIYWNGEYLGGHDIASVEFINYF